jgi:hypothetical protein
MRKVVLLTSVALVTFMISGVQAREISGSFAISPFGGIVIPIGDAADNDPENPKALAAKTGFCAGANAEYGLTENVVVGGRFGYNQFGFDEDMDLFDGEATLDGSKWTVMEFGAYLKLLMSAGSTTRPYFKGGVMAGKAKFKADATSELGSGEIELDVATALGIEGGVGILHMFSENVGGFAEGTFNHLMTDGKDAEILVDGDSFLEGEAEGNVQWITVRAGVTFFLGN